MPTSRIRMASRSVSGSPTNTAMFSLPARRLPVSCIKVVLPLPGDEHTFTTNISGNRSRMAFATKSFAFNKLRVVLSQGMLPTGARFDFGFNGIIRLSLKILLLLSTIHLLVLRSWLASRTHTQICIALLPMFSYTFRNTPVSGLFLLLI